MTTRPIIPAEAVLLVLTVLLASCSTLPPIKPFDGTATNIAAEQCRRPFLNAPHRFVHTIEAEMGGRPVGTLLGVTLFDPSAGVLRSALLTLEGLVLFDALYDEGVSVLRAVAPFDTGRLAENMLNDIRLLFLAPRGRLLLAGAAQDGGIACRYEDTGGRTVDVVIRRADTAWEIESYGENHELLRKIEAFSVRNDVPHQVVLTGFVTFHYKLRLTLISAEPVSPEDIRP